MRGYKATFRGKSGISGFSVDSCAWIWGDMPSGAPGERVESEGPVGDSVIFISLGMNRLAATKARLSGIHAISSQWGTA